MTPKRICAICCDTAQQNLAKTALMLIISALKTHFCGCSNFLRPDRLKKKAGLPCAVGTTAATGYFILTTAPACSSREYCTIQSALKDGFWGDLGTDYGLTSITRSKASVMPEDYKDYAM